MKPELGGTESVKSVFPSVINATGRIILIKVYLVIQVLELSLGLT